MPEASFERGKERAFDAYCKKVLRNFARDLYRRQARLSRWEAPFSALSPNLPEPSTWDAYPAVEAVPFEVDGYAVHVFDERIAKALLLLAPELCRIVLLAYFMQFSDPEIAQQLGVPRSTVQYRRSKALSQLSTLLANDYDREV